MAVTLLKSKEGVGKQDNFVHRRPPTFVGIGSLRCGSTWLYSVLKCHPDIKLSDRKEMCFFFPRYTAARSRLVWSALRTGGWGWAKAGPC